MVRFKAAYLSLGGRSLAGGSSSLHLGPSRTCFNIRHAYPFFIEGGKENIFQYEQFKCFLSCDLLSMRFLEC